jgi:integrase
MRLLVLAGMTPGEILALRWGRVDPEMIEVAQRVYRGLPDDPKTERGNGRPLCHPILRKTSPPGARSRRILLLTH